MYFYLENLQDKPQFLIQKPSGTVLGTITWRYDNTKRPITIIWSNDLDKINDKTIHPPDPNFSTRDMPILRSQLQKCARRKKHEIGLKTAYTMSCIYDDKHKQIGLFEMLRRITIIIIEDCVVSYDFTTLVWFQCALSKNITLSKLFVTHILNLVSKFLGYPWKDKSYSKYPNKPNMVETIERSRLSDQDKDLLLSIQLRNSFHGMHCDVDMLNRSTLLWYTRVSNKSKSCKHLNQFVLDKHSLSNLERSDIQLEALDHHCTDIIKRVQSYIPLDDSILGSLIWDYSSSINSRLDIERSNFDTKQDNKLWDTVKNIVHMEMLQIKESLVT